MKLYDAFGLTYAGFDPGRTFVRSDFVPTLPLASLRALISIYCFSTIIVGYTWQAYNLSYLELQDVNIPEYLVIANDLAIGRSFSYFTWLCFWSQAFYFLISSIHGVLFARRGHAWLHSCLPVPLQLMYSVWYTTVTTFPFLVSAVFWGTMMGAWPKGTYEKWLNLSVHGLNSLFALIEICIPATQRPPVAHLSVLLMLLSLYLGLAYLTKLTQDFYVYEWLNPSHGHWSIIFHIMGYTGGILVIFLLQNLMLEGKQCLTRRFSKKKRQDDGDTWECDFDLTLDAHIAWERAQKSWEQASGV